jgi:uracil-DNA glycosylase
MPLKLAALLQEIRACRVCSPHLPHQPRPIIQAGAGARILIIGQAPGSRVQVSGVPWDDDSGDRLRDWTGLERPAFYDPEIVALMPMGFCYPGAGSSGDLPPRPECAPLWHARLLAELPGISLTLLVGRYAQARYLPLKPRPSMTEAVRGFAGLPDAWFPLPHPSWRSTLWLRRNPWFETDALPILRARVRAVLGQRINESEAGLASSKA